MSLLGKNISANLLSNLWSTVPILFLTPLYILILGVESYGLIGFYLSLVAILGILDVSVSLAATTKIAWRSARPEMKKTIPVLLKSLEVCYWFVIIILGLGILIGAWFFGAGWFEAKSLSPDLIRGVLMLMAVSLVVQVPSGLYIGGLMGLQRQVECSALLAIFGTLRGLGSLAVLGGMFAGCAHPSLSILYSRKQLKPVVVLNLICVIGVIPLLVLSVHYFDTIGAACIWSIYGIFYYIGCQIIGLRDLPNTTIFSSILENFIIPFLVAFAIAGISAYWLSEITGNLTFVFLFLSSLVLGWFAAFLSCKDLREIVLRKWIFKT